MEEYILNNKYLQSLDKSRPVLVALSTGVDSMVLYHLLLKNGFKVVIAHVNHHKREQSELEEQYVKTLEMKYNTKAYIYEYYHETDDNFQAAAHTMRYEFFYDIIKKENCSAIVTAHHYEDSLETILMNILKGSNVYGYAGIKESVPYKDIQIIRPLLEVTKEEIYNYAKENNIKYFEDESNSSDDYLRNRIRHHIIPLLEKENSNLPSSILNYSTQLSESFAYIRENSIAFLNGKLEYNNIEFNKLNIALKKDIINYLFEQYKILPSKEKINKIIELSQMEKPNISYNIGLGYIFIKEYNRCYIKKDVKNVNIDYSMNFDDKLEIPNVGCFKFSKIVPENEIYLKINRINLPLHFRNRQNSDKITLTCGHKKLKDFLIDKKVPMEERDNLVVITDNTDEIVWVLGYYRKPCEESNDNVYLIFNKGE